MKNFDRGSSGITLIALVVTIIVLLILAGVSIWTLTGNKNIINQSFEAKNQTDYKDVEEEVMQQWLLVQNETRNEYYDDATLAAKLQERLKKNDSNAAVTSLSNKFNINYKKQNLNLFLDSGQVAKKTVLKANGTDISTADDITTLYGQTVDYKSKSHPDIMWQLFLADEDNYYLIASDYVPNSELPCNGNDGFGPTDLLKVDDSEYGAKFCSSWTFNNGVLSAGTDYKNGATSNAIKNNPLTSKYLKWVAENSSSKNNNVCVTAFMMDISKWKSFADGAGASYAIGGPTIEMLSLSWNAVDGHTQMTTYTTLNDSNSNSNGYKVKSPETNVNFFGTSPNMWFLKSNRFCLASMGSYSENYIYHVHPDGRIYGDSVHNSFCFRPIVVIPK